jgi:hypothetical protein
LPHGFRSKKITGRKFLEFCDKFHICVDWAAVAHPQTNGQVERGQQHDSARSQAQDFRQTEQVWPKMAPGATSGRVEPHGLFVWLVADGWCWFILRKKYR